MEADRQVKLKASLIRNRAREAHQSGSKVDDRKSDWKHCCQKQSDKECVVSRGFLSVKKHASIMESL